jgi:hypothetical protein
MASHAAERDPVDRGSQVASVTRKIKSGNTVIALMNRTHRKEQDSNVELLHSSSFW